jgi:hypothetical protein
MEEDNVQVSLIPAADEPPIRRMDLKDQVIDSYFEFYSEVQDVSVPLAQVAGPIFGAALVAWVNERSGRKVRLKFDDVDSEARSPEQVEIRCSRLPRSENASGNRATTHEPARPDQLARARRRPAATAWRAAHPNPVASRCEIDTSSPKAKTSPCRDDNMGG